MSCGSVVPAVEMYIMDRGSCAESGQEREEDSTASRERGGGPSSMSTNRLNICNMFING